ncbi:MAG: hypothetical protein EB116_08865 [Betaproteobacteria bacterium]|nr:hypothetical protein [Betaproteobacteria bacterium]
MRFAVFNEIGFCAAVVVRQNESLADVGLDLERAVGFYLPPILGRRIHFPKNDAIILAFLSNSFPSINLILNFTS